MKTEREHKGLRRLGRLFLMLFFGHPQVLVTVPFSVGLLVHLIASAMREESPHGLAYGELARCIGLIVGISLFAVMALCHLAMVVYQSWIGNGNAAGHPNGMRRH